VSLSSHFLTSTRTYSDLTLGFNARSPQLWEFAGMGAHFSNDFRELRTRISLFEEERGRQLDLG
jgi:hypothetical protein